MKKILYTLIIPLLAACGGKKAPAEYVYQQTSPDFCEDSAYSYVAAQCAFGPRTMNSEAHELCGEWIASKFKSFGLTVTDQYADSKLYDGTPVKMRNIIASINPDAPTRVIVSGHWDSRPWADNDEDESKHQTPIDGANDGGSCVGIMLEMARTINMQTDSLKLSSSVGIDFICWDAEDCGSHENEGSWCLGSQYWSGIHHSEGYTARYGINLDMVGGKGTIFPKEGYSLRFAPTLVDRIWATAMNLGFTDHFKNQNIGYITDDHVQVNQGGIPCVDIIGYDAVDGGFPTTWHTIDDNIKNIDKPTLKAVGQTVTEVIYLEK